MAAAAVFGERSCPADLGSFDMLTWNGTAQTRALHAGVNRRLGMLTTRTEKPTIGDDRFIEKT
eukprot:59848-Hanusia_phi.AAC.2